MNTNTSIPGTDDAWDTGVLGADPNFAAVAEAVDEGAVDAALGLQPISIRLQRSLIEDFKLIAQLNGLGYQTLMRRVLARFADCEKKRILREVAAAAALRKSGPTTEGDDGPRHAAAGK